MPLENKRILIFQQRGWAINIGHDLAKKLQAEGCKLAAFTLKKSTHNFIIRQTDVHYEYIVNHDEMMENPSTKLNENDYSLEKICEELNINSVWPLLACMRNLTRSYSKKFYYSYSKNVSDEEMIAYIKILYKTIKNIFENFKPQLIISPNFVSFPHIMFNLYAQKHGVQMFGTTDSKIKNYNLFVHSFYEETGSFFNRVDELNNGTVSNNEIRAQQYIDEFRKEFITPAYFNKFIKEKNSLKSKIKKIASPWFGIVRWYLNPQKHEDLIKNIGATIDYRPPKIIFRDYIYFNKYKKFAERFAYYPFEKIDKFIYFPLQFQPESSIDVMAPFFNNQIEIARLVAQSLPDDYTLVVKEHPAMVGYRSPDYYRKISKTVNVKLINFNIPSEKILKRTSLIISPNSTTIAEAAFLKKPAIQLGNLGTTLKLPNVFKHTDLTTLSKKIKDVLKVSLDNSEYERRLKNFVAAVYDTGFEFNYTKVWENGTKNFEPLWLIYRKEIINSLTNITNNL